MNWPAILERNREIYRASSQKAEQPKKYKMIFRSMTTVDEEESSESEGCIHVDSTTTLYNDGIVVCVVCGRVHSRYVVDNFTYQTTKKLKCLTHFNKKLRRAGLSSSEEDDVRHLFKQLQVPFHKHKGSRKNMLGYDYLIKKLLELKGHKSDMYKLPKSSKKLQLLDSIFEKVCSEIGLIFTPTVIDKQ